MLAGETQAITSLYLDTPSLTFLRWHLEGASERFKLRVRAYGSAPHTIVLRRGQAQMRRHLPQAPRRRSERRDPGAARRSGPAAFDCQRS